MSLVPRAVLTWHDMQERYSARQAVASRLGVSKHCQDSFVTSALVAKQLRVMVLLKLACHAGKLQCYGQAVASCLGICKHCQD